VYDMYPWDSASQGDYPPEPLRSRRDHKNGPENGQASDHKNGQDTRETSPVQAVQTALDRRDNGGAAPAAAPRSRPARPRPA
jgi:hypothetical protein